MQNPAGLVHVIATTQHAVDALFNLGAVVRSIVRSVGPSVGFPRFNELVKQAFKKAKTRHSRGFQLLAVGIIINKTIPHQPIRT